MPNLTRGKCVLLCKKGFPTSLSTSLSYRSLKEQEFMNINTKTYVHAHPLKKQTIGKYSKSIEI